MSWGTCYSGSNNIHNNFPPMMSDSRNVTVWKTSSAMNENIKKNNRIESNLDYRSYLMKNSENIINDNRNNAYKNCCSYLVMYSKNSDNVPYMYTSNNDNSQPYGYVNSDLKNIYLSREKLNSKSNTPFVSENTLNMFN